MANIKVEMGKPEVTNCVLVCGKERTEKEKGNKRNELAFKVRLDGTMGSLIWWVAAPLQGIGQASLPMCK